MQAGALGDGGAVFVGMGGGLMITPSLAGSDGRLAALVPRQASVWLSSLRLLLLSARHAYIDEAGRDLFFPDDTVCLLAFRDPTLQKTPLPALLATSIPLFLHLGYSGLWPLLASLSC